MQKTSTYRLIDSGAFKKLEQAGPYLIIRPAAAAAWRPANPEQWTKAQLEFKRTSATGGEWVSRLGRRIPTEWQVSVGDCQLNLQPTPFGHLGLFAEHLDFSQMKRAVTGHGTFRLLNLFAYTGVTSIVAAQAGAEVTHVDASHKSVEWARANAELNGISSIRWICDDAREFVRREARRGRRYDGIILDPPSFGRGPKGKAWKIEEDLPPLLDDLAKIMSEEFRYLQLTCHTPGYSQITLANLVEDSLGLPARQLQTRELAITDQRGRELPSGSGCYYCIANN